MALASLVSPETVRQSYIGSVLTVVRIGTTRSSAS